MDCPEKSFHQVTAQSHWSHIVAPMVSFQSSCPKWHIWSIFLTVNSPHVSFLKVWPCNLKWFCSFCLLTIKGATFTFLGCGKVLTSVPPLYTFLPIQLLPYALLKAPHPLKLQWNRSSNRSFLSHSDLHLSEIDYLKRNVGWEFGFTCWLLIRWRQIRMWAWR